jgi:hypothetical protein
MIRVAIDHRGQVNLLNLGLEQNKDYLIILGFGEQISYGKNRKDFCKYSVHEENLPIRKQTRNIKCPFEVEQRDGESSSDDCDQFTKFFSRNIVSGNPDAFFQSSFPFLKG